MKCLSSISTALICCGSVNGQQVLQQVTQHLDMLERYRLILAFNFFMYGTRFVVELYAIFLYRTPCCPPSVSDSKLISSPNPFYGHFLD